VEKKAKGGGGEVGRQKVSRVFSREPTEISRKTGKRSKEEIDSEVGGLVIRTFGDLLEKLEGSAM
jgi:hypothetical protein